MKKHGVSVTGAVILYVPPYTCVHILWANLPRNPLHDSASDPEAHATAIPLGATGQEMNSVIHIYSGGRHNFPLPTIHERDW